MCCVCQRFSKSIEKSSKVPERRSRKKMSQHYDDIFALRVKQRQFQFDVHGVRRIVAYFPVAVVAFLFMHSLSFSLIYVNGEHFLIYNFGRLAFGVRFVKEKKILDAVMLLDLCWASKFKGCCN